MAVLVDKVEVKWVCLLFCLRKIHLIIQLNDTLLTTNNKIGIEVYFLDSNRIEIYYTMLIWGMSHMP